MRAVLAFFLLAVSLPAATLADRIDKILGQPAARRAFWGIKVVDLGTGRTLFERSADRLFVPASNTKLFTTALALSRLGPDYRYLTRIATDTPPDSEGRIAGDLVLVGGGDPNLSARVLPYFKRTEFLGNPLEPLEELAAQVADLGVRQIDGDIVGDDTYYVWQRYAEGWMLEDATSEDGPPITALVVNDNTVSLRVRPGDKIGDPARIEWRPHNSYFTIDNRIRTVAPNAATGPIRVAREPGERAVRAWGEIALDSKGHADILAIDDPALFAAEALKEALERRGIVILGRALSRHAMPFEVEDLEKGPAADRSYALVLASRSSMPLIEDLRVINKVSQNLHGEIALREVARQRRGIGSFESSLAEMKAFLAEVGIPAQEFFFLDGSGLSRKNLVSPGAIVTLLVYMWKSPYRDQWAGTLPIAGFDGSLQTRFVSTPAADRLRAKTGTLAHVSALSGYVQTSAGRPLAFSVMVNNYNENRTALRAVIDRICLALVE